MTTHRTIERIDPDDFLGCSTLTRIDHVDAHAFAPGGEPRDPLTWAREILEGPGAATRLRLRAGWTMLGIRLRHREAADVIAGWPVTHHDSAYVRLQAASPIGLSGELITRVAGDRVEFATLVRLGNPVARLVWAQVLPTHLSVVRSLMNGAAARAG